MLRSDWSILDKVAGGLIVVIFGLIWIALPPKGLRDRYGAEAYRQIEQARKQAAPLREKTDEAQGYNPPCHEGQEDRQSDLCAQWKAADSAASAAHAGWVFGTIGTAIGLLTLIAAGAAAKFARDAAIQTKRGADAADASVQSNRAWMTHHSLNIGVFTGYLGGRQVTNGMCMAPSWKNTGGSPAINVRIEYQQYFCPPGDEPPVFNPTFINDRIGAVVGSNDVQSPQLTPFGDGLTDEFRKREVVIYLYTRVTYQLIYSDDIQSNDTTILVEYIGSDTAGVITEKNVRHSFIRTQSRPT